MGTQEYSWAGAATCHQDSEEGGATPPVFRSSLVGTDILGSGLVHWEEERGQQISLAPFPLLSQSTGAPFL